MEYGGNNLVVMPYEGEHVVGILVESPLQDYQAFFQLLPFDMGHLIQFAHMINKYIADNYINVPQVYKDAFGEEDKH